MKKQNLTSRKKLGEFCDQFAYETKLQYSSKSEKQRSYKTHKKSFRKSDSTKKKYKSQPSYKKPKQTIKGKQKSYPKKDRSQITCYKCGVTGHYANKCRTKLK